jgi:hypothetical protein
MRIPMIAGLIASSMLALPAFAQQAPVGGQVVASSPGKGAIAQTVKASALVTAIDKATRTVTLKPAHGASFEVECGDEVKNFDQIAVGDEIVVQYVRALSLELKKSVPAGTATRMETSDVVRSKPGEKPGGAIGRQVTVMTEVVDVNPKKKTISLKGPKGNVVVLDVRNPEQFKVVKKGDKVEAVYTEAVAISLEPAKKSGK